jgi:hypothetical protein
MLLQVVLKIKKKNKLQATSNKQGSNKQQARKQQAAAGST